MASCGGTGLAWLQAAGNGVNLQIFLPFGFCILEFTECTIQKSVACIHYSVFCIRCKCPKQILPCPLGAVPWILDLDSAICRMTEDHLAPTHGHQPCRCCTALSICPVVDSDSLPCPPGTRRVSRGSIAEFLSFLLGGRSHVLPAGVHHAMRRTSAAKLASASGSGLCCLTEKSRRSALRKDLDH